MNAGEADAEGQSSENLQWYKGTTHGKPVALKSYIYIYNPCHVPGSSGPAKEGGGENRFQPYWETERAGSTSNIQRTTAAVSQDRNIMKPSLT